MRGFDDFDNFKEDVYKDEFISNIMDTEDWTSHHNKHTKGNEVELLDRLISSNISGSSRFNDIDVEDRICQIIAYRHKEIEQWLENENSERKKDLSEDFGFEDDETPEGIGYVKDKETGKITEKVSNVISIVLEKNNRSKYGFILKTAYPDVTDEDAINTDREILPILFQTKAYSKMDSIEKTYTEALVSKGAIDKLSQFKLLENRHTGKRFICLEEPTHEKNCFNRYVITGEAIIMSTFKEKSNEKQGDGKQKKQKQRELIYSDITEITKKAMCDGEKIEYKNNLLTGGNHAAFKSLHPKTCAVIDTIYNRIRELEGLPPDEKTVVESKYQQLMPITGLDKENEKTNSCEKL